LRAGLGVILTDHLELGWKSGGRRSLDLLQGIAERALFVLDRNGMIAWSYVAPLGINPGADGRAIDAARRHRHAEAG